MVCSHTPAGRSGEAIAAGAGANAGTPADGRKKRAAGRLVHGLSHVQSRGCGLLRIRYSVRYLSNGCSSRLNRRLVQEQNIFSGIDAYISGTRDAGLLQISGKPAAGVSLEQAEAAVRKELEELQRSPVDGQELEKVKNKFESTQIFGNINYLNVATNLAWFELTGKAEDIDLEVERYRSVTTEQLHTVAQRTFCESNAVVLYYKSDK